MRLKDICSIRTGLVLSRKISDDEVNSYKYKQITLKSVQTDGCINTDEFNDFFSDELIKDNYLAADGDVLVRLTAPFNAIYVDETIEGVVVPSHFVIIKADKTQVLPQYIAWYLKRERIKKAMLSSCVGALLQVKPTFVADIEINLPPLSTQEKVVEIDRLSGLETRLYNELVEQKQMYYNQLTRQINKIK